MKNLLMGMSVAPFLNGLLWAWNHVNQGIPTA